MKRENLVALEEICIHHEIDTSFVDALRDAGLIEVITVSETHFIGRQQLPQLEQYIEFHYSLDINLEGLETISHLLKQIHGLQEEVKVLKNVLQFYESRE